jgi:hypothetical protein
MQANFFAQVTATAGRIVKICAQFTGLRIDPVDEAQLQE